jgi:hypothetical protein
VALSHRHFERSREIFVIRGQVGNVWKVQNGKPDIERLSGIALLILCGAFRHPERSEMPNARKCKGKAVRTEPKDLAPHHHFSFLIPHLSKDFLSDQGTACPVG